MLRATDDAKLMDATVNGAAAPIELCDELMASAAHPDDACRRRTSTRSLLAPPCGDLGTFIAEAPHSVKGKSALASNPVDCDDSESLAKAVACARRGSFLRAEGPMRGLPTLWKFIQLVQHVGSAAR